MTMAKQLPKREEVPEKLTWDVKKVYRSDALFEEDYKKIEKSVLTISNLQGTLSQDDSALLIGLKSIFDLERMLEKVYVYANLKNDQDTENPTYQALNARAGSLAAKVSAAVSWLEPEIIAMPKATLDQFIANNQELKGYQHFFDSLLMEKAHVLSHAEETLLAGASDIFGASSKTFEILNNADLKFPVVQDERGNDVQLSQGIYGVLLESTDRSVREQAFKKLYEVYGQFQNTLASTLSSHVKVHNYSAQIRHYENARDASLSNNQIPEIVYNTLVEQVNKHLPLLHRYVTLRKKILNVEKLHSYDLYTPMTGEPALSYTYDEAKDEALKALHEMGPDYLSHVQQAFDDRWIDVVENQGKRSGAYSSGMYDTAPYMLLNWQNNVNNLYTLVHEMGHSVHSYYTHHNQPYLYGDYPIFLAEIASTTNENTLTHYLLKTQTDPKVRAFLLNYYLDGFKGTVFRQTQFAEFEHWIHEEDAAGNPLTADKLSSYYADLNQKYYGDSLERDPEIAMEWSRIPHFYYNYYVYQYATGFAAATTLSEGITSGKKDALDHYLTYLKAGSSDFPIDVMKKAGVDMTKSEYLDNAFSVFEIRLNELEALLPEILAK
ncbi:oligoendopeptidase F [Dellaglioa algida]|uniref:Oligopeptidase F n=1 Tax=Dellaglioa algida TaxID=105612 RepID=A0A5C6M9X0_9LACO|nr:oligoendopeptidase F [Dellaglioa algida]MDK1717246.1 oligoendopeptidase F [Dellaglioa algida]MDK1720505.1 oligoendopeptidase F [Dellaglioa algida]MDK1722188.1 oligoendopeptidase F [Dellaglioa algida]MDK1723812.1 oligoendopeptidase F [Dellaglioa algida]MDK1725393.1 oligoendopeptidase F [Dellaglioa algida]